MKNKKVLNLSLCLFIFIFPILFSIQNVNAIGGSTPFTITNKSDSTIQFRVATTNGYYQGFYTFDQYSSITDLANAYPNNLTISSTGISIQNSFEGHYGVMELSRSGTNIQFNATGANSTGEIEFWFSASSTTGALGFSLSDSNNSNNQIIYLRIYSGEIAYYTNLDSSYHNLQTYSINIWYHIEIIPNFQTNTSIIKIGTNSYSNCTFRTTSPYGIQWNTITFQAFVDGSNFYIDAIDSPELTSSYFENRDEQQSYNPNLLNDISIYNISQTISPDQSFQTTKNDSIIYIYQILSLSNQILDQGTIIPGQYNLIYNPEIPNNSNVKLYSTSNQITEWKFQPNFQSQNIAYSDNLTNWLSNPQTVLETQPFSSSHEILYQTGNPTLNYDNQGSYILYYNYGSPAQNSFCYFTINSALSNSMKNVSTYYIYAKDIAGSALVNIATLSMGYNGSISSYDYTNPSGTLLSQGDGYVSTSGGYDYYKIPITINSNYQYYIFQFDTAYLSSSGASNCRIWIYSESSNYASVNYYSQYPANTPQFLSSSTSSSSMTFSKQASLNIQSGDLIQFKYTSNQQTSGTLMSSYSFSGIGTNQMNYIASSNSTLSTILININFQTAETTFSIDSIIIIQFSSNSSQSFLVDPDSSKNIFLAPSDSGQYMLSISQYNDSFIKPEIQYFNLNTTITHLDLFYQAIGSSLCQILYTNNLGNAIDYNNFQTYVNYYLNGIQNNQSFSSNSFTCDQNTTVQITTKDVFGSFIQSKNFTINSTSYSYLAIPISYLNFKIYNQLNEFVDVNLTKSGFSKSDNQWCSPQSSLSYSLLSGYYIINITDSENISRIYNYHLTSDNTLFIGANFTITNNANELIYCNLFQNGYYQGNITFDQQSDLNKFGAIYQPSNTSISIINSLDGHRGVLHFNDSSITSYPGIKYYFTQTYSELNIEYWFYSSNISAQDSFIMRNTSGNNILGYATNTNGQLFYIASGYPILCSLNSNQWHHIEMNIDFSNFTYNFYIDNIKYSNLAFYTNSSTLDYIYFSFASTSIQQFYLDALDFSFDSGYYTNRDEQLINSTENLDFLQNYSPDQTYSLNPYQTEYISLANNSYFYQFTDQYGNILQNYTEIISDMVYNPQQKIMNYISLYDSSENSLTIQNYRVYLNGSLNQFNYFYLTPYYYENISIYDLMGRLLSSKIIEGSINSQVFNFTLNIYNLKIQSFLQEKSLLNITYGNYYYSEYIMPNEILSLNLLSDSYTINWIDDSDNSQSKTINLNRASYFILNTTYERVYFSPFGDDGFGINPYYFRFYINNIPETFDSYYWINGSANIKVLDYFNNTLYNKNLEFTNSNPEWHPYLPIYSLIINNNYTDAMQFVISRSDVNINFTQTIPNQDSIIFNFEANVTYKIQCFYLNGTLAQTQFENLSMNPDIISFGMYSKPITTIGFEGINWSQFFDAISIFATFIVLFQSGLKFIKRKDPIQEFRHINKKPVIIKTEKTTNPGDRYMRLHENE